MWLSGMWTHQRVSALCVCVPEQGASVQCRIRMQPARDSVYFVYGLWCVDDVPRQAGMHWVAALLVALCCKDCHCRAAVRGRAAFAGNCAPRLCCTCARGTCESGAGMSARDCVRGKGVGALCACAPATREHVPALRRAQCAHARMLCTGPATPAVACTLFALHSCSPQAPGWVCVCVRACCCEHTVHDCVVAPPLQPVHCNM